LITWPGFRNISRVENKHKLADLIFDSIGAEEARFGIRLDGETEFLHIRSVDWALKDALLDQYDITGVVLNSEESARWLQDYFEKKLIWKQLSQKNV
jgi:hypothetical protein